MSPTATWFRGARPRFGALGRKAKGGRGRRRAPEAPSGGAGAVAGAPPSGPDPRPSQPPCSPARRNAPLGRRGRALVAALALSFVALASWVWRHGAYPQGGWGGGATDHISHYGSAILLAHRGLDVWRRPLHEVCPEAPAGGPYDAFPSHDVCNIDERAGRRPLVTNWRQFPRPYPPGWALWHAPAAVAHEATSIDVYALNRLVVIQDLLAAHVALGLFAALLFSRRAGESAPGGAVVCVRAVALALGGAELLRWSTLGYYDAAAVALAFVALWRLRDGRDADAALWLAASLCLHFRALWFAPLFAWLALRLGRAGPRALAATRGRLAAALGLVALAAGALALVRPSLAAFPATNPAYHWRFDPGSAHHWNLLLPVALAFAVMAWARAWLVAAVAGFQLCMVALTPQTQPWHSLFLLPLIGLARVAPGARGGAAELATCALYLVQCGLVFESLPLPGEWLAALWSPPSG